MSTTSPPSSIMTTPERATLVLHGVIGVEFAAELHAALLGLAEHPGEVRLACLIHQRSAATAQLSASAALPSLRVLDDLPEVDPLRKRPQDAFDPAFGGTEAYPGPLGREALHLPPLSPFRSIPDE